MHSRSRWLLATLTILSLVTTLPADEPELEVDLPNEALKRPFAEQIPMVFVSRGQNKAEWAKLPKFFNELTETALDPLTGKTSERKVIKIKMPLGLNVVPTVPGENAMTFAKWQLGKQLYYDPILSSDGAVSCSTCHTPKAGFSDASKTSKGISGSIGGMNAPTVMNSAFNRFQFWDGRAESLEAQSQGPVQNNVEMFDGKGNPWNEAIKRVRKSEKYATLFEKEFGHGATRDTAAKAIATYERTVLVGNSIQDRADVAARTRAEEEENNKFDPQPKDYEKVLREAFAAKDIHSLQALNLDPAADAGKIPEVAKSINNGRLLFFGKARCNNCHVGETFTDHTFHNLGVGVVDGKIKPGQEGRFAAQPIGAKDVSLYGAFKTPALRGLLASRPYMHDGGEKTLEEVVNFYDKGGNANEFLDPKMRDFEAEKVFMIANKSGAKYTGPEPKIFTRGGWPVIPKVLGLTPEEKKDLVTYMRALEGDPIDEVLHKGK
ncbi:cytochrome-c peroxidase [Zavarzinella formosa]|uniref:cytochrome-c peroxidase n=1 Tax=Zavarzinella formosa TaxID=360055 RepID=UPI0002FAD8FC|nr:cytochrome c peroxidase [Zavarzinella formosa]